MAIPDQVRDRKHGDFRELRRALRELAARVKKAACQEGGVSRRRASRRARSGSRIQPEAGSARSSPLVPRTGLGHMARLPDCDQIGGVPMAAGDRTQKARLTPRGKARFDPGRVIRKAPHSLSLAQTLAQDKPDDQAAKSAIWSSARAMAAASPAATPSAATNCTSVMPIKPST